MRETTSQRRRSRRNTLTLTNAQIALISDYTDLHVEVIAGDPVVPCCVNPIPTVLYATITDVSGCSCVAGTYKLA